MCLPLRLDVELSDHLFKARPLLVRRGEPLHGAEGVLIAPKLNAEPVEPIDVEGHVVRNHELRASESFSERIASIMKERKGLNANVDFYSATVYYSMGIPTDLFTPVFAIARCAGWAGHVMEQLADNRLYRPLSEYTGPAIGKKFLPIAERS